MSRRHRSNWSGCESLESRQLPAAVAMATVQPGPQSAATSVASVRQQMQQILEDAVTKYGVPGLSASVILGDRIWTAVAGVRASTAPNRVENGDRFGSGSTTKAMTATLAAILVERGVIRWDTTISDLFPKWSPTIRPEYRDVTIEQLLQHRGGIIADDDASEALIQKIAAVRGTSRAARLALAPEVLKEPVPVSTGTFRYSNAGYAIAATMMEAATGQSYERLMQRYIFNPLGMSSATFDPPVSNPLRPKQPIGHLPDGTPAPGDQAPFAYLSKFLHPAGAELRMNSMDWSKFIQVHLGQKVNGVQLLTSTSLRRLHLGVPIPDAGPDVGYAMGWVTVPAAVAGLDPSLGRVLTHDGSDGVWLSQVAALPDANIAITIMANGTVDRNGTDLGAEAFVEIRNRLVAEVLRWKLPQTRSRIATPVHR